MQIQAFFRVIFTTWPVSDHAASREGRKKLLEILQNIRGVLSKSAQLFGSVVEKTHMHHPLTPLPPFLLRSVFCAFTFNTRQLAVLVWKMRFRLFSHLPLILCRGQEPYSRSSSPASLRCAAAGRADVSVCAWGGSAAVGYGSGGSCLQNSNDFRTVFLASKILPVFIFLWLSGILPLCAALVGRGWLLGEPRASAGVLPNALGIFHFFSNKIVSDDDCGFS